MKWLNLLIKYRLPLGILLLGLAIYTHTQAGFWPSFALYFIAVIMVVGHFLFGPMRLIQTYMEEGDIEGAKKVVDSIWFPGLLIKPVRSVYYTIKGNLAMVDQDYDGAEKLMKKSLSLGGGTLTKQSEGPNKIAIGDVEYAKGNIKEAEAYIRQAIRAGLPDNENNAAALSSIVLHHDEQKRIPGQPKNISVKPKDLNPLRPRLLIKSNKSKNILARMPG
jgi:tetratricopeptide (TPR) repeat protein